MSLFPQRLPAATFAAIQSAVQERLAEVGLDAVLTDDPEDVAYLTGFFHHACERPVAVWLPVEGEAVLLLPRLEHDHAVTQNVAAHIVEYPEFPGRVAPFAHLATEVGAVRVGHALSTSYERLTAMRSAFPAADIVPTDAVMRARHVKRPEEVALHAEAGRIADLMLGAGVALVREAVAGGGELPTEAELAAHVGRVGTSTMYAEHSDVVVVPMLAGGLVYAGANSALPHGLPSGYRLRSGDTFMLSLGCAVGGRFVESERTFVLGEPTPEQVRFHTVVREAQEVGGRAIAPGVACRDANEACLDVLYRAGLGEYVLHRQGHGIGLGMHESPWLEDGDPTILLPGMVVSNEPGIYVRGHAGYRISDSMLVTEDGAVALTSYPRHLDDCVIAI